MLTRQLLRSCWKLRVSGGQQWKKFSSQAKEDAKLDYVGIAFFSSICIAAGVLGTWQVKRYLWKVDLIESIKKSAADPPGELGVIANQQQLHERFTDSKGQRVLLSGVYDHSNEVFLGLRTAPAAFTGGPAQGMASNPQGYYIITPLVLDNGTVVHVNRGWVPRQLGQQYMQEQQTPPTSITAVGAGKQWGSDGWRRPTGRVAVEAVVGEGEKAGTFSPVTHPGARTLLWLDTRALLQRTSRTGQSGGGRDATVVEAGVEAADLVVIAEALVETPIGVAISSASSSSGNSNSSAFPYMKSLDQLQEQSVAPATHFVYALTWFSLASAGLFMTYLKFRRGGGKGRVGAVSKVGDDAMWTPVKERTTSTKQ